LSDRGIVTFSDAFGFGIRHNAAWIMNKTHSIVIVDDQPAIREGLRMRLGLEADIKVTGEARDGKEALDVVARLQPDIVIMDLEMPVMDGLEATRKLQSLAPKSQVILLTIHDDRETRKQAREAGAVEFVSKHADDAVLLNAIRALANRMNGGK
jgi:DNA-binding NarL/FixJ family response regulator